MSQKSSTFARFFVFARTRILISIRVYARDAEGLEVVGYGLWVMGYRLNEH